MILTVTLNTALDVTYTVDALVPHSSHRVGEVSERPGGKGLNVARVLGALGHDTVVTGFVGGATGGVLRDLLAPLPPRDALVPVAGNTRRTLAITDRSTGDTTQLNEPGPQVSGAEWAAFLRTYEEPRRRGRRGRALRLAAARHPRRRLRGAGPDRPRRLRTCAPGHQRRAPAPGHRRPPRPGQAERGRAGPADRLPRTAARRGDARRRGAHAVIASLGPEGLLAVTPQGTWRAAPPAAVRGNPTGAGDSAVAGLLSALAEGLDWPGRLARAVALSTATVLAPAAGEFDAEAYAELLPRVSVESAGEAA